MPKWLKIVWLVMLLLWLGDISLWVLRIVSPHKFVTVMEVLWPVK